MPSLYSNITSSGNVSSSNFTTLYSGTGLIQPQGPYGNANVVSLLAVGSDGGNTIGNISATGNIAGGNVSVSGNVLADYFIGNLSGNISGNITAAGANTQVQFNNNGSMAASANLTFDTATNALSVTGNVTAADFIGSGQYLTNLPAANLVGNVANAVYADLATYVTGNAQANITSVGTLTALSVAGNVTPGNISTVGNVSAAYFLGNVSCASGIFTNKIFNGQSNVQIAAANANVTVDVAGVSNVATFATSGVSIAGNVSATGNVNATTAVNTMLISGNASANLTLVNQFGPGRGPVLVDATKVYVKQTGASSFSNFAIESETQALQLTTTGPGNPSIFVGKYNVATVLTGNVEINSSSFGGYGGTGNINLQGNVYVSRGLAGSSAANGWANLMVTDSVYVGKQISAAGNITAGTGNFFIGNGSQLTGVTATMGGNLSANLVGNGFGADAFSFVSVVGNVTAGNVNTGTVSASGNITTTGNISTTGNVLGTWLWGDGSNITGVVDGSQTVQFEVKNTSGSTLTRGTPIYVTGTVGATTVVEVAASRADTPATMPAVGVLEQDLANNASGYAVSVGTLSSANTSAFVIGEQIYVASTGGFSNARPTGSNVIQKIGSAGRINSTTGSIQVNLWNIEDLPNLGNGNIWLGNTSSVPVQTNLATYTGNIGAGNVVVTGLVTATGNVTGGNVVATANLTSTQQTIVGTANAGTTGNIVVSGKNIATDMQWIPDGGTAATAVNGRINVGTGWNGNISHSSNQNRFNVTDSITRSNTATQVRSVMAETFVSVTGNVLQNNFRQQTLGGYLRIGGGPAANTVSSSTTTAGVPFLVASGQFNLDIGNTSPYNLGNTTVSHATVNGGSINVLAGSNVGNAFGIYNIMQGGASNVTVFGNMIGYSTSFAYSGNAAANVFAFYHPSSTNTFGPQTNNPARSATQYYAFYNEDDAAQSRLGSLRTYHEFQYNAGNSGTININKNNAQVQYINPTGNVTIGDFQNFVTTANDGTNNDNQADTVTVIIEQGATPYTVTMPTGNAAIKYLGGTTTVGATANAVSIISIKAVRSAANATMYLTAISSEYT